MPKRKDCTTIGRDWRKRRCGGVNKREETAKDASVFFPKRKLSQEGQTAGEKKNIPDPVLQRGRGDVRQTKRAESRLNNTGGEI